MKRVIHTTTEGIAQCVTAEMGYTISHHILIPRNDGRYNTTGVIEFYDTNTTSYG